MVTGAVMELLAQKEVTGNGVSGEREFGIIFNKEAEWRGRAQVELRNLVESRNLIYAPGTLELEHRAIFVSQYTTGLPYNGRKEW
ncbi:hypothetical protein E2C01_078982 [Portunus trituberculatus]|uniref:Uncharacterized protein n=1 Tax=Portunus trituberculatus TaxID=210409 RepID=A0A5B7IFS6_PORTR|nr:hypothetical protein [Portunus trituberculatus]